jgi:transposase-like protein
MQMKDRKSPSRRASSESRYSLMEFMAEFADDEACLQRLWRDRYSADGTNAHCPKCKAVRAFHRYETKQQRQSWTCAACGHHLHPTAGTIYHKSSTSLHLWFYAMYLMTSTRCGISAKQLERELGVTYKTAWRIFNKIRSLLDEEIRDRRVQSRSMKRSTAERTKTNTRTKNRRTLTGRKEATNSRSGERWNLRTCGRSSRA